MSKTRSALHQTSLLHSSTTCHCPGSYSALTLSTARPCQYVFVFFRFKPPAVFLVAFFRAPLLCLRFCSCHHLCPGSTDFPTRTPAQAYPTTAALSCAHFPFGACAPARLNSFCSVLGPAFSAVVCVPVLVFLSQEQHCQLQRFISGPYHCSVTQI